MLVQSASWFLDHLDSKRVFRVLVIANVVGVVLAMMLLFFA
jgi:hypothetical protein